MHTIGKKRVTVSQDLLPAPDQEETEQRDSDSDLVTACKKRKKNPKAIQNPTKIENQNMF